VSESFPVERYLRDDLQAMTEYKPGKTIHALSAEIGIPVEEIIKLDANENPYGPSPRVYEMMADYRRYHFYPDAQQSQLRQGLAEFIGLDADHILAGNGSDELLDLVCKVILDPDDGVLSFPPTFGVYAHAASLYRGRIIEIPRRADLSLDVDAVEAGFRSGELDDVKLCFACSPNNPGGPQLVPEEVARLLALPMIVVLDEAYVDFCGGSLVHWVPEHSNLIVLRTFSKWLGLAGLRIGYGVFPLPIIRQLWKIKPPFNVNAVAQAAALVSLEDVAHMEGIKQRILAERERLWTALDTLSFLEPYPSETNYVLVRVTDIPAVTVREGLAQRGILVRFFREPELGDHLRITVGRPEQNDALLAALSEIGQA
jgi:histidinol-phosphate aminotransferase